MHRFAPLEGSSSTSGFMLTGEKRSFKKHSVQLLIYDREHQLIAFSWNVFFLRFGDLYRVKAEKKVVKNALLEIEKKRKKFLWKQTVF